jgi:hypothetical protein
MEQIQQSNDRVFTRTKIKLQRSNARMLELLAQEVRIACVYNGQQTPSEACLIRVSGLEASSLPPDPESASSKAVVTDTVSVVKQVSREAIA